MLGWCVAQKPRNKKQLAKKVVTGSAKVPLKSAVFLVTKTGKFVFKLPAQVAYRGTRGAYRKMKSRRRVGPGMIFSEAGDQQVIEGPLHKWVNYVRGWQKRWFLLEAPGLLAYYSNHKKKTCLGTIPLSDAIVTISRRSPLRFVVDTDYGIFYLRATSADQRNQWIQGIKHSQQQAEQPDISEGDDGMAGGDDDMSDSGDDYGADYGPYGYGNPHPALTSELDERLALVTNRLASLEAEKQKFSQLVQQMSDPEQADGASRQVPFAIRQLLVGYRADVTDCLRQQRRWGWQGWERQGPGRPRRGGESDAVSDDAPGEHSARVAARAGDAYFHQHSAVAFDRLGRD